MGFNAVLSKTIRKRSIICLIQKLNPGNILYHSIMTKGLASNGGIDH